MESCRQLKARKYSTELLGICCLTLGDNTPYGFPQEGERGLLTMLGEEKAGKIKELDAALKEESRNSK